jgi:hypothetical protein
MNNRGIKIFLLTFHCTISHVLLTTYDRLIGMLSYMYMHIEIPCNKVVLNMVRKCPVSRAMDLSCSNTC